MSLFQGHGGSCVSGGQQAGPVSRPAGARGRGPLPGSGEPLSLPGGFSSRELPGHCQPLHPAHPAGDGAPQVQSRPTTVQRLQVYGQAHQQCVWQEKEVSVTVPVKSIAIQLEWLGCYVWTHIKGNWRRSYMVGLSV